MSLLEKIATFENLDHSFRLCSRGKRKSDGFKKLLMVWPDKISEIKHALEKSEYHFSGYRKFVVHDPKARLISAPTFQDRVVHTAICQVIEPILDSNLTDAVYACRFGKGNRYAVINLIKSLQKIGKDRFVIKLDVEKYFDSIDHDILMSTLRAIMPDRSIEPILLKLLKSYSSKRGLPIGSLTSQLFSNLYLHTADRLVHSELREKEFYFRYMDDLVIGAMDRTRAWNIAKLVSEHITEHLKLCLPYRKIQPIGSDPLPFLGFVLDHNGYRILTRNQRRHLKQMIRLKNARESRKAEVVQSFNAWKNLEPHLSEIRYE